MSDWYAFELWQDGKVIANSQAIDRDDALQTIQEYAREHEQNGSVTTIIERGFNMSSEGMKISIPQPTEEQLGFLLDLVEQLARPYDKTAVVGGPSADGPVDIDFKVWLDHVSIHGVVAGRVDNVDAGALGRVANYIRDLERRCDVMTHNLSVYRKQLAEQDDQAVPSRSIDELRERWVQDLGISDEEKSELLQ